MKRSLRALLVILGVIVLLASGGIASIVLTGVMAVQAAMCAPVNLGSTLIQNSPIGLFQQAEDRTDAADAYLASLPSDARRQTVQAAVQQIVQIGLQRSQNEKQIDLVVSIGLQESGLTNPVVGLGGAVGQFQQTPGQYWGTAEQIINPVYSTNRIFDEVNKRYADTAGFSDLPLLEQALLVQRPNEEIYRRDWRWNEIGPQFADKFRTDKTESCVATSSVNSEGWRSPLDAGHPVNPGNGFGTRFSPTLHRYMLHAGVDMNAGTGVPIYAIADGTVESAGPNGAYGNYILIDHGGGIDSAYAHQSRFEPGIRQGQTIKSGQIIGYVGATGRVTGAHLHFEIHQDNKPIDPEPFLRERGVNLNQ